MSDSNVVDYLREQFSRVHSKLDAIQRTLGEHGHRLTAMEIATSRVRRDAAGDAEAAALAGVRVDGIEERLARLERRLDVADAG